jgi:hypothetical protein
MLKNSYINIDINSFEKIKSNSSKEKIQKIYEKIK